MSENSMSKLKSAHQQAVEKFMHMAEQPYPESPEEPSEKTAKLRAILILEEALETIDALGCVVEVTTPEGFSGYLNPREKLSNGGIITDVKVEVYKEPDIVEIADGCADLSVVTTGTLSACGIPDLPLLRVVDDNNLEKVWNRGELYTLFDSIKGFKIKNLGDGFYVVLDKNGKLVKPPSHKKPDIEAVLRGIRSLTKDENF